MADRGRPLVIHGLRGDRCGTGQEDYDYDDENDGNGIPFYPIPA